MSVIEIKIPPDKSLTHRAFILASLSRGICHVNNALISEDTSVTRTCMEQLGVHFECLNNDQSHACADYRIDARKFNPANLTGKTLHLDFGNSGTTARLVIGIIAGIKGLTSYCHGDQSLSRRPMARVTEPLESMGAIFEFENQGTLPLTVIGCELKRRNVSFSIASAQLKSALILAGLMASRKTPMMLTLPRGSRNHTENFLRELGIEIHCDPISAVETITLGEGAIHPFDCTIPADPSSAAFFTALLIGQQPDVIFKFPRMVNNSTRCGFYKKLKEIGFQVQMLPSPPQCGEQVADYQISLPGALYPCVLAADEVPGLIDEIPILSVIAAFADGTSCFSGLKELTHKESNRLERTQALLESYGITVASADYNLSIDGQKNIAPMNRPFETRNDHRMAMCAVILNQLSKRPRLLGEFSEIAVSMPNFFKIFDFVKRQLGL